MPRYASPSNRREAALGQAGVVAAVTLLALVTSGCSLITGRSGAAEPSPSAPPGQAAPREPLGPLAEAGRIEMAGSGFAITVPDGWTVEVASPDPDVTAAPRASAWEAMRTSPPDGSVTCSVYVGVPPAGRRLDPERFPTDTSATITWPRWEEGPERMDLNSWGLQLVTPRPVLTSGGQYYQGHGSAPMRLPGSHANLPDGAQYVLECWWPSDDEGDSEAVRDAEAVTMFDSFTLLDLG